MRNEQGVVLLIVMIVSILLALLGLSMTFTSMTDFSMSLQLENKKKALLTADAGYEAQKESLRGSDLSSILATTTVVSRYINYAEPTPGTVPFRYFSRNPLAPMEVINVDFDHPPSPIATRNVNGLLTPASGNTLPTGGRFWAKISDNDDGDGDLTADVDGQVYLRVIGVQRNGAGQVSTYGGTVKNSMAIIEVTMKRDMTLLFDSAFSIYGPDVLPSDSELLSGNSFELDGFDHPNDTLATLQANTLDHSHAGGNTAGIEFLYDDSGGGDATTAVNKLKTAIDGPPDTASNVIGNESDYGGSPALRDGTQEVRADPEEDAQQIFDATFVERLMQRLRYRADNVYAHGSEISGNPTRIGGDGSVTAGATPEITYCEGDCSLKGGASGAGLTVVRGKLTMEGAFTYRGLILVVGEGNANIGGTNMGILGGLFLAKMIDNGDGTYSYGIPKLSVRGQANVYYQASGVRLGSSLLSMKTVNWREITPEIEP
jgi:hypothetical protein